MKSKLKPAAVPGTLPPIVRWEYLIGQPASETMKEEKLQAFGRDGWEVCGNVGTWLFKRQLPPNRALSNPCKEQRAS